MLQKLVSKRSQVLYLPSNKLGKLTRLTGIFFVIISGLAWLLTFPFWEILVASIPGFSDSNNGSGDRKPLFEAFFRNYPQLIWLGFLLGAGLLFLPTTLRHQTTDKGDAEISLSPTANPPERFVSSVNLAWRLWAIALLGLAISIAVFYRFSNVRGIGATDIIPVDYDEGVLFTSSVLLRHGILPYRDFFSSQPPLALWLWSLPMNFGGSQWGSLSDFLNLRLFNSIFSILTVALGYLIGRKLGGSWRGTAAGVVVAFILALDKGIFRVDQQLMLEPLVNFFSALAMLLFLYYRPLPLKIGSREWWLQDFKWPVLTGVVVGLALAVKFTALPLILTFGLTLLIWKRWWAASVFAGGVALAFLLFNSYFLLTGGSEFIKQVIFYQLIRPIYDVTIFGSFNSSTELTALDYMARTPALSLTMLASGLGLIAIIYKWILRHQANYFLPVVLLAVTTNLLFTTKNSFFPHYYAQIGFSLALLAAGLIYFWPNVWWKTRAKLAYSGAVGLAALFLLGSHVNLNGQDYPKPNWSWERASVQVIKNLNLDAGVIFSLDPRLSMFTGFPIPKDVYGKYWVENAAYSEYITLGLNKTSLGQTFQKAFFQKKPTRNEVRQLRYSDVLQNNFLETASKSDYFIWEDWAASQTTSESLAKIQSQFIRSEQNSRFNLYANPKLYTDQNPSITLGDKIDLEGIKLSTEATTSKQGQRFRINLIWKGQEKIAESYIIFVHLLDAKGNKVAQRDTPPQYGQLPTNKWEVGTLILDDQSLNLPANLPPGVYTVKMGVYNQADGKRLSIGGQALTSGAIQDENSTYNLILNIKL